MTHGSRQHQTGRKHVVGDNKERWTAEQERIAGLREATDCLDFTVDPASVDGAANFPGLRRLAGVDLSFFPDSRHAVAAVVVLSYPELEVLYEKCATLELSVPYVPGYLAFREVPALAAMLRAVGPTLTPDVVFMDGNGAFHPRRCGAATHLGVVTDLPTVGVAKDVMLVDGLGTRKAAEVSRGLRRPGDWAPFAEEGREPLAALVRPGSGQKALVVSPGHRICLRSAVALVRALTPGRVVEPIRQADLCSRWAVAEWLLGRPLPELRLSTEPAPKRRRDRRGAPVEDTQGPGAEDLQTLLKLLPGAVDKTKEDGKDPQPKLTWKPKVTPPTPAIEAAIKPAESDLCSTSCAESTPDFKADDDFKPDGARGCCTSWEALVSFVHWAFSATPVEGHGLPAQE